MFLDLAADAVALCAVGFLVYIAWYDYRHFKIRNNSVLILLGMYAVWAVLTGFDSITTDLVAAVVLFILGFVMWMLRLMGAGDVKLYFGLGLFMGLKQVGLFAILLMAVTLVFLIALFIAGKSGATSGMLGKLRGIKETGKAPYAVLMCAAAIPVTLLRVFSGT